MRLDDDNKIIIGKGVNLKPYTPRPLIHRNYMTENEIRSAAGGDLILDSESFPNYFMIGFKHVQSGNYIRLDSNFNPHFLSWLLFSFRTIGFNSITYDLPILWASYVNRNTQFIKIVSNELIQSGKRPNEIAKEYDFKIYDFLPRQHIDLFNVCPLKGSLKLYGARLHSKRIQDLPFPDNEDLEDWQIPIVQDYNCNDLDVTGQIFKFCKERLELREAISIEYDVDLMSKSDAQMAEVVIAQQVSILNGRNCKRPEIEAGTTFKYKCPQYLNFVSPQLSQLLEKVKSARFVVQDSGKVALPEELKTAIRLGNSVYRLGIGGLHSSEEVVTYYSDDERFLFDVDVVSYYPRIITNLKLFPIGMGPNFLNVYNGFINERVIAKQTKKFTKDKGLKIFINGASGKFSDIWSKLFSPDLTIQMTVTGQLTLLLLVEILEVNGFSVISANTDGIVIYCKHTERNKLKQWIAFWERLTGFKTEDNEYKIYCARDVNAYFAVKKDGSVKVKGPYSEVGSQSGTQLDNNPIMLICSDAIKSFLSTAKPIEETIRECRDITRFVVVRRVAGGAHKDGYYLGKVVRWAYYKGVYGTINYVLTGNKVPDTDGAMPLQDLPDDFPIDKIDYEYYIRATKDILYDIGYYQRQKQVEFF